MDDETRPGGAMPAPDGASQDRASQDRASQDRASELTRMTAAELAAAMTAGQVSALEVTDAHLGRIDACQRAAARLPARRGGQRPRRRPRGGRAPRGRGRARAAGRRAAGSQRRVHHHGHAHHLRLAHPRQLAAAVRRDRDPAAAPGRRGAAGQDQHGRVRDGLLHRELGVRAVPQPVGPGPGCPAARPGARRRRSRASRHPWVSAPTPEGPSGSPPRCAASSVSSRPTAARPGTG